jgi:hypothetical protein
MEKKVATLEFNPNDFFYYNAEQLPTSDECTALMIPGFDETKCSDSAFFELNGQKCLKSKLCENKLLAETVFQNQTDGGIDIRLDDMTQLYNHEKQNCINYSLGIAILSILIIRKTFIYFTA